jgi:hypothetical protein
LQNGKRSISGPDSFAYAVLRTAAVHASANHAVAVREWLRQKDLDGETVDLLLRALVSSLGEGAVPDLREALRGPVETKAAAMLVKVRGIDAVPDLLERAKESGFPHRLLWSGQLTANTARFPAEVFDAFLSQLPPDLCNSSMLQYVLFNPRGKDYAWFVRGALEGTHGKGESQLLYNAAGVAWDFLGEEEAWRLLLPLLDHKVATVRDAAQRSLTAIRDARRLRQEYAGGLDGGKATAREALASAMALAKSKEPDQRRAAALALTALADPGSLAVLLELTRDADPTVREAAQKGLERLAERGVGEGK